MTAQERQSASELRLVQIVCLVLSLVSWLRTGDPGRVMIMFFTGAMGLRGALLMFYRR